MKIDIKDVPLSKTTKEFAAYLRDLAQQIDRIPDRPLFLREEDVEVGFYYGHPVFQQMPTGLHFTIDSASTEPHGPVDQRGVSLALKKGQK